MVNIGIGTAALAAFLGYAVVFMGIISLMAVITLVGKCMKKTTKITTSVDTDTKKPALTSVGIDPKKVAVITAAIAEYEGERL